MRFYGLDTLRALMMLLGVVVHAAYFFTVSASEKYIELYDTSLLISYLQFFLSSFRMETFFILCGFLSGMVLIKKDRKYYIKNRIDRVLIPLITGILLISVPFILLTEENFTLKNIILHFWFLITLLIFSGISITDRYQNILKSINLISILILYLIVTLISIPFIIITKYLPPIINDLNFIFIYKTIYYIPYFTIGYYLYIHKDKNYFSILRKPAFLIAASSLVVTTALQLATYHQYDFINTFYFKVLNISINNILSLSLSLYIFIFFLSIGKSSSKTTKFLIDSSLVVYMVHYPIIFLIEPYAQNFKSSVYSFFFICTLTFIISFLIFKILKIFKITRFLFGIK